MVPYLVEGSNAVVAVDIVHSRQVQMLSTSVVDAEHEVVERHMVLQHRNGYLHSQE